MEGNRGWRFVKYFKKFSDYDINKFAQDNNLLIINIAMASYKDGMFTHDRVMVLFEHLNDKKY